MNREQQTQSDRGSTPSGKTGVPVWRRLLGFLDGMSTPRPDQDGGSSYASALRPGMNPIRFIG